MPAQFNPTYQSIYQAALARQRANEARQRALLTNAAARAGVGTSGVGQIGQAEISRAALMAEEDIGADIARQQEQERLQRQQFEQQKELYGMSLAEAAAERARQRRDAKAGITGQLIGTGLTIGSKMAGLW